MSRPKVLKPNQAGQLHLVGTSEAQLDAALSPAGDLVATLDADGHLLVRTLWDAVPRWSAQAADAGGVCFVPGGLLTVGWRGLAERWDAAGARLAAVQTSLAGTFIGALRPSGGRWVLRWHPAHDQQQILDLDDLARPAPLLGLGRGASAVFTPEDDGYLAVKDGALEDHALPGGALRRTVPVRGLLQVLGFGPDRQLRVLSRVESKRPRLRVQVLSWPALAVVAEQPIRAKVKEPLWLSPDALRVFELGRDLSERVVAVELATGEEAAIARHLLPHGRCGAVTPDGHTLLGVEWGGVARLMDLRLAVRK